MRPSAVFQSGMPTGHKYMGWWGAMGGPKQKGVTSYSVSPYQQSAMRGALKGYVFYGYKRLMQQAPYFVLPFGIAYAILAWGKQKNDYLNSKEGHRLHAAAEE
ncbi:hypothetical protein CBS101457_000335 [Exobasidium rhododendri]|nr:hypothetical protein CBS101457_000335 [Exobasidium rhododendri]